MGNIDKEVGFLKSLASNAKPAKLRIGMSTWELSTQVGRPDVKETKQLKTKVVETFKYQKQSRGYVLKVILEDGKVVSWDDRRQT